MAKPFQGRFDGLHGMRKFTAEELVAWAQQHETQIAAPGNADDAKWLQRRADRLRRVAIAKEKAREQKERERRREWAAAEIGAVCDSKARELMQNWKRGDLVELDGLLAVVVRVEGDAGVPEDHVAVWFGDPRPVRKSQDDISGRPPELWTVPTHLLIAAASPVWKH